MHVLGSIGHSFSSRRKTSTPKDLHIRKISFSGCSLSSASSASSSSSSPCSLSSSSTLSSSSSSSSSSKSTSASTVRGLSSAPCSTRSRTGSLGFDPLSLHPTFQPPPRLHERPLISPDRFFRHALPPTPYDDAVDGQSTTDVEDEFDEYTVCRAQEVRFSHQSETVDAPAAVEEDYFLMHLAKKANVPRSRWSDSTIQSLDLDSSDNEASDEASDEDQEDDDLEMPNFSRKRCTEPSRPPMRSLDGLDDFIKKGCWKRRGIVFNTGEVRLHSAEF